MRFRLPDPSTICLALVPLAGMITLLPKPGSAHPPLHDGLALAADSQARQGRFALVDAKIMAGKDMQPSNTDTNRLLEEHNRLHGTARHPGEPWRAGWIEAWVSDASPVQPGAPADLEYQALAEPAGRVARPVTVVREAPHMLRLEIPTDYPGDTGSLTLRLRCNLSEGASWKLQGLPHSVQQFDPVHDTASRAVGPVRLAAEACLGLKGGPALWVCGPGASVRVTATAPGGTSDRWSFRVASDHLLREWEARPAGALSKLESDWTPIPAGGRAVRSVPLPASMVADADHGGVVVEVRRTRPSRETVHFDNLRLEQTPNGTRIKTEQPIEVVTPRGVHVGLRGQLLGRHTPGTTDIRFMLSAVASASGATLSPKDARQGDVLAIPCGVSPGRLRYVAPGSPCANFTTVGVTGLDARQAGGKRLSVALTVASEQIVDVRQVLLVPCIRKESPRDIANW